VDAASRGASELTAARDEGLERICLRNLLAYTRDAIYFKDRDSRFVLVSRGVVEDHYAREAKGGQSGERTWSAADFIGKSDLDLFEPELAMAWIDEERHIVETGEPMVDVLERDSSAEGDGGWFITSKAALRDEDGTIIGTFGVTRDVTARVLAEREVARREAQLRAVLDSSPDVITSYGRDLRHEMVNAKAATLIGRPAEEIVGHTDAELGLPPRVVAELQGAVTRVFGTRRMCELEFSLGNPGSQRWWHVRMVPQFDEAGEVTSAVAAARDLSELKAAQGVLVHKALHDALTGLANRVALVERLTQAIASLEQRPGRVAVLFIDIDNFKLINDAHGHERGDQVLVEVAGRLTRAVRRGDTVARLGGDEFVVLFDHLAPSDDVVAMAERVRERVIASPLLRKRRLSVTTSIGAVVTDDPAANAGDLLRDADIAMYRAKEKGRDRVELFESVLRHRADERHRVARDLRRGLDQDQFFLVYQPIFALGADRLTGVEALARWRHPRRGMVPPSEFIPVAEERGYINALGKWALNEALAQLARWSAAGLATEDFVMSVNAAARQLASDNFVAQVVDAIGGHGIAARQLCLEITETGMIEELERCREYLEALGNAGVRLALDDFGTGFSSLAHLHDFRVNTLKIDRTFVARLDKEGDDLAIVAGVTAMAHAMSMEVVAEGVETEAQRQKALEVGCDKAQGYLLARPMSAEALTALLSEHNCPGLSA